MKQNNLKIFFSEPILTHEDFIRLIHNGAWAFLTRRQGIPPSLPPLRDCADLPLSSFQLKELDEFHDSIQIFFALGKQPTAHPQEKIGQYAGRLADAWLKGKREIIFHTSGSTGKPRPIRHSEEMLRQEMLEVASLFKAPQRVIAAVPLLHSYGLIFGLLLPKVLAVKVLDLPPLSTIIFENLKAGDLLVGFPLLFSRLDGFSPHNVHLLSATAPCPDSLFEKLTQKGYEMAEIYGATETGAMAVRFDPDYFRLLSYWHKKDNDHLLRELPTGQDMVWPLPDHLNWHDQVRFRPAGRRDNAVQVAGINVYPARVAALIKEHPEVKGCVVRLMKPEEGERLKAFVVTDSAADNSAIRRELNVLFRSSLSPPERPGSLTFGPDLPQACSGKDADWAITGTKISRI